MDFKTVEKQIADAANDIGAEIENDAKSLFATITSAISSFLGFTNPRWKQFVVEWRVWTWTTRAAFLAVAGIISYGTYAWGSGAVRLFGGNVSAAVAYANGDVVRKADIAKSQSELGRAAAAQKDSLDALKQRVDALSEKFDGLSDSIRQLQIETGALLDAAAAKPVAKVTTGSLPRKQAAPAKPKAAGPPSVWDQMKAVLP